ncbi:endonuclease [Enterococcus cecorum]|uniref:endonuclease n=1 Tax=Enterococcus cecorum TaxID=44008 RepID=UPI0032C42B26
MTKLYVKSIIIVDFENERANKFVFSDSSNLILSNSSGEGKSSLLKSIYYALGTNIKLFPQGWNAEKYIFQLEVCFGNECFIIKRQNKVIIVQEKVDTLIFSNFSEYSKWFQKKLGLDIRLVSKNFNSESVASIDALFAPYYIDQDKSWNGSLFKESFEGLGRYKPSDFPKNIIENYLGITNSESYKLQEELHILKNEKENSQIKYQQIIKVEEDFSESRNVSEQIFENVNQYQENLDYYIELTNSLSEEISKITKELITEKIKLDVYVQNYDELNKLLDETRKRFKNIHHECIYCHSILTREQTLTRLDLEDNRLAINTKMEQLRQNIAISESKINDKQLKISELERSFENYNQKISMYKNSDSINQYINQRVLTELKNLEISQYQELKGYNSKIDNLNQEIKKMTKQFADKKKEIELKFDVLKNDISYQMGISGIIDKKFGNYNKIKGSGSNWNKEVLTIFLIYMNLIDCKSKISLPFAIDSFVKNEIDTQVLIKMFSAVNDYFLNLKSQTFFSVIKENLAYLHNSEVNIVEISKPLLSKELYRELEKEIITHKI